MKVLKATYTPRIWNDKEGKRVPDPDNAITVSVVKIIRERDLHAAGFEGFEVIFFDDSGDIGVEMMWCFSYFRWEEK